jgi:aldehyde dehydrogenase family 7 protein A1
MSKTIQATPAEFHDVVEKTREAYASFRLIPAPRRGEILRQIREALSAKVCYFLTQLRSGMKRILRQRNELGALVSLEMGKILSEGIGEVQEFIDIVSGPIVSA